MDSRRFDALTRALSTNTSGTRRALGVLLGVVVSLLTLGALAPDEASARKRKRKKRGHQDRDRQRRQRKKVKTEGPCGNGSARKNRCRKNRHCCTNYCDKGKRKKGRKRSGRCRCRKLHHSCSEDRNCCPERTGRTCVEGNCQAQTCLAQGAACPGELPCCAGLSCQDAACQPPPPCAETCQAGCCAGDDCKAGDIPEFCGSDGAACQTCAAGLQCLQGICDCGTGTVCAVGCSYPTLQAAIDDPAGPDDIELCATTFAGPFTISRNVAIFGSGDGEDGTILDGQGGGSAVTVASGVSVTLQGLRITGGSGNGSNDGGGILNNGGLSLELCTVTDNHVIDNGGGIYNGGSAVLGLFNSTVTGNTAGDDGGGILNDGLAELFSSTVTLNTAGDDGGGINNLVGAALTLENSRVTDNTADEGEGGGIHNTGTVTFAGTSCLGNNDPDDCIGTATCPICSP